MAASGVAAAVRDLRAALDDPASPLQRVITAVTSLATVCSGLTQVYARKPKFTRDIRAMCAALAEATTRARAQAAAVERLQGLDRGRQAYHLVQLCGDLTMILSFLLDVLIWGASLQETDVVRLLTAAAAPLDLLPRMLRAAQPNLPRDVTPAAHLSVSCYPVVVLLRLAVWEPSPLPPRALAILKAVHLRPDTLLSFLEAVVPAAIGYVFAVGSPPMPRHCFDLLAYLLDGQAFQEVQAGVQQRPQLQRQIVHLAALGLCNAPAQGGDEGRTCLPRDIPALQYVTPLLAACLGPARWQHEAAASEATSLLNRAAMLAASPGDHHNNDDLAIHLLRITSLSLAARLMSDVPGTDPLPAVVVCRLRCTLAACAPLLADVAAAVAAAAPAPASSAASLSGAAAGASVPAADSGMQQLGQLCWGRLRLHWLDALNSWGAAVHNLCQLEGLQREVRDASGCVAAAQAAIGLLRLAPLLPQQPDDGQPDSGTTAADAVAAEGGEAAVAAAFHAGEPAALGRSGLLGLLSLLVPDLVRNLLQSCTPQCEGCSAEHAALVFAAFNAACRYSHLLAAELARGRSGAGGAPGTLLFLDSGTAPVCGFEVYGPATMQALLFHQAVAGAATRGLVAGLSPELAQSRLECVLLLTLSSIGALPWIGPGRERASFALARCSLLNNLLLEDQLCPLWQQLLDPATAGRGGIGQSGGGMAALLQGIARTCVQEAVAAWPHQPLGAVRGLMSSACFTLHQMNALAPKCLYGIARDVVLLRALCQAGKGLLEELWASGSLNPQPKEREIYVRVWSIMRVALHAVKGSNSPLRSQFSEVPVFDRRAAGQAFDALLAQLNDSWGSGDDLQPPPLPDAAAAGQMAVRCARALSLRNCAYLCCANLAASSGEVRGRRCSGCRVVRYCSERCGKADWRGHKVACRLLQAEQQQQGAS